MRNNEDYLHALIFEMLLSSLEFFFLVRVGVARRFQWNSTDEPEDYLCFDILSFLCKQLFQRFICTCINTNRLPQKIQCQTSTTTITTYKSENLRPKTTIFCL